MAFSAPIEAEQTHGLLAPACAQCAVRNSSLCASLPVDALNGLNRISVRRKLQRGQSYVLEGDDALSYANVVKGFAKLVRSAADGRAQIVGLLFPSDFLGLNTSATGTDVALYSIEAATDLELCTFPRDPFHRLVQQHPQLEADILKRTFDELQVAREWMVVLGRKTAKERVASFLLHVARRMLGCGCFTGAVFDLPLNRAEIADHIGLTLETVSRQISQLRKAGVLEMTGTRQVDFLDMERLEEIAGF